MICRFGMSVFFVIALRLPKAEASDKRLSPPPKQVADLCKAGGLIDRFENQSRASLLLIGQNLLSGQQPFEILHDLGRSDIFLSLIAMGEDLALPIDDDQARNAASGIFF